MKGSTLGAILGAFVGVVLSVCLTAFVLRAPAPAPAPQVVETTTTEQQTQKSPAGKATNKPKPPAGPTPEQLIAAPRDRIGGCLNRWEFAPNLRKGILIVVDQLGTVMAEISVHESPELAAQAGDTLPHLERRGSVLIAWSPDVRHSDKSRIRLCASS